MEKLLLIDGHSILNRGFYAIPPLTNKAGEYTNAVYGFLNIFLRFFDEEKPDYVIVAFDLPKPTFRHEQYAAYKGTRKPMPDELRPQVPLMKQVLTAMRICITECPGFEADDVLGTLAVKAEAHGIQPVIVTGDRDLLQLANEIITIRIPKTKMGKTEVENYRASDVVEKMGVTPRAYIDVKALMGDTSDNIPGVPGIGEVTATKIIAAYGSVENAIGHADEIKPKKASENLTQYKEQALLSKALATIALDAPVEPDFSAARTDGMWNADTQAVFERLEFKSLLARFKHKEPAEQADVAAESANATAYRLIETEADAEAWLRTFYGEPPVSSVENNTLDDEQLMLCNTESMPISASGAPLDGVSPDPKKFHADAAAFHLITENGHVLGIGVDKPDHTPVYLHINDHLTEICCMALLRPWLESHVPKLVQDSKCEASMLLRHGISLNAVVLDAMLAGYVLDVLQPTASARVIAYTYLNETIPDIDELLDNKGKRGKDRRTLADLPKETTADYACRVASVLRRAYPVLHRQLTENGQLALYADLEQPLAHVLLQMENAGIQVNRQALTAYGETLDAKINQLTGAIYDAAGEPFNIQSPVQLGSILFDKLHLPGSKKTTQGWSTAADVLEKLVAKHPIVSMILEYRAYAKLKSTYVDGLLPLIDSEQRIHSTFHQALTATGRLSSAEPNLQNIPVRMALGRELRKAFVPPDDDTLFVDADYSQIELRILAHMSGDETLINAFIEGQDIHRLTASQVFHTSPEVVTPEQRSNAKAVNFGIVYGISAFGLSEDLKISRKEAERYIQGYFEKYPHVKTYLDETVANAKRDGYAATMFNRRRAIPELRASNAAQRSFGERVAMNMPIQGSAADIIKIAMLHVTRRLERERLHARLILQVHDELLLETPRAELEIVKALVKEEMENAVQLSVPLVADVHEGVSWYDAK